MSSQHLGQPRHSFRHNGKVENEKMQADSNGPSAKGRDCQLAFFGLWARESESEAACTAICLPNNALNARTLGKTNKGLDSCKDNASSC